MPTKREKELVQLTKVELIKLAKNLGLSGCTKLTKEQVIELICQSEKKAKIEAKESSSVDSTKKNTAITTNTIKAKIAKNRTTSSEEQPPKTRTKKGIKETSIKEPHLSGAAIQHPSASPNALKYARFVTRIEEYEGKDYKSVVWPDHSSIPDRYGKDRLITLIRDPFHIVCFWELSTDHLTRLADLIKGDLWNSRRMVLQLFKDTGGLPKLIKTIDLFGEVGRYHIEVPEAGATYFTEIGFFFANGRYETVLTDRSLRTPQTRPSRVGPVRWLMVSPSRSQRIVSLETRQVSHPSPLNRALRQSISKIVAGRRLEFGISDIPTSSGSDMWNDSGEDKDDGWQNTLKSGKN
jgi:hypothetical protein